jgi:hypothetical protein
VKELSGKTARMVDIQDGGYLSMNSVGPVDNPTLNYLAQLLSSSIPPFSPEVQSILQEASSSDFVELSDVALQSQSIGGLFVSPGASQAAQLSSPPPVDIPVTMSAAAGSGLFGAPPAAAISGGLLNVLA